MASVNVNFRMDEQLKKNVEDICGRMGMNLTTALTIFCRKLEQERRIPFEVTAEPDPFYSEANMAFLRESIAQLDGGKTVVKTMEELERMEHE